MDAMISIDLPAHWALRSLAAAPLNTGFVNAVLEGQVRGRFWADRIKSPRVMHALHPYGMSLVWGAAVDDAIGQIIDHLRSGNYRTEDEWLQIDPRWDVLGWNQQLGAVQGSTAPDSPCARFTRVNFDFNVQRFEQQAPNKAVPDGWKLRSANESDFDLAGQVVPNRFWDSALPFLAAGGGWCAVQAGQVGAIAFVSYRWGDKVEIGVETFVGSRRQGLGRAVAARMLEQIVQGGLNPVWSCRRDNIASYDLARKLGFAPLRNIPYFRLSPGQPTP